MASVFWRGFTLLVVCSACSSTSVGTGGDGGAPSGSSGSGSSGSGSSGSGSSGGPSASGDLDPSCRPTEGSYSLSFVRRSGDPEVCPDISPQTETLGPGERFAQGGEGCTVTKDGPCSVTWTCTETGQNRTETTFSFTIAAGGGAGTGKARVRKIDPATNEVKADCEYGVMMIKQ